MAFQIMLAQPVLAVGSANNGVYAMARGLIPNTAQREGTLVVKLNEYDTSGNLRYCQARCRQKDGTDVTIFRGARKLLSSDETVIIPADYFEKIHGSAPPGRVLLRDCEWFSGA